MTALATLMPGFEGTELPAWVERRLREGMGGVCLFGSNVESPAQLRSLTDAIHAANPHAIVSIDEEGGDVSRLYQRTGSPFPGNAILGRLDDLALTREVGAQVGRELAAVGVNLTLAPDVDINSNLLNPVIGVRSFGTDPALVGRHGVAWTQGVQSQGVAANAKHFPGHGDTAQDSHHDLPVVDADLDTLRARELAPFQAVIDAGALTIMSSHIMVPALDPDNPATFSHAILTGLLREEMRFKGLIVSDALDMAGASGEIGIPAAAARALAAGCDLLCIGTANTDEQMGQIVDAIDAAVASAALESSRVADAAARVRSLASRVRGAASEWGGAEPGVVEGLDLAAVRDSFSVSDAARAALDARAPSTPVHWLRFEPAPNMAVGASPWGPFAAGAEAATVVGPSDALDVQALPSDALILAVGKDNHRHPWIREAIDALRARDVITVDMGWPDSSSPYADIATYGASRLAGAALLEMVS
ncbi:beta-N-acetylhexosaminidase [Demequina sp. NBRC 110053]|uniref:beta-N-acetylhexosaminidase n=1 Tax=Demequina sp. NBRC 110053 TaxID=1570342 RepID=UPI000A005CDD|nr:beta-N-acetylhexosaminidase [Demequina sp. NBRC 110053]